MISVTEKQYKWNKIYYGTLFFLVLFVFPRCDTEHPPKPDTFWRCHYHILCQDSHWYYNLSPLSYSIWCFNAKVLRYPHTNEFCIELSTETDEKVHLFSSNHFLAVHCMRQSDSEKSTHTITLICTTVRRITGPSNYYLSTISTSTNKQISTLLHISHSCIISYLSFTFISDCT